MPSVGDATDRFRGNRRKLKRPLERAFHPGDDGWFDEPERRRVGRLEVGIVLPDKRVRRYEFLERTESDERLQVNRLVRREEILLLELQMRIGNHEVRARHVAPSDQLRDQQHGDGDAPDVAAARDDEKVEIAGLAEIQMSDAA